MNLPLIPPIDLEAQSAACARQNTLTKPLGSVGRLEELSIQVTGRGTGAALAFHLVEAAARILDEMATLAEAGVSDRN